VPAAAAPRQDGAEPSRGPTFVRVIEAVAQAN